MFPLSNMQKFEHSSIGTKLFLQINSSDDFSEKFSEIIAFLDAFDDKYSRFKKDNWLYTLNQSGQNLLDEHTEKMIFFMQKIARETDGYFDPTIGKRLSELGYGNSDFFFSPKKFSHQDLEKILTISENIVFIKKWFELEFGGLGKWYLIDWIFDFLQKNLPENVDFLINFGGDMACRGTWKIALESPFVDGEAIGILEFSNSFLACSAGNKRKFWKSHHLINPYSGESAREIAAVFLETPNMIQNAGMLTDSLATAFSVMDWDFATQKINNFHKIQGVLVRKSGEFFKTPNSHMQLFS